MILWAAAPAGDEIRVFGISPPSKNRAEALDAAREALFRDAAGRLLGVLFAADEVSRTNYQDRNGSISVDREYARSSLSRLRPIILRHIDFSDPVFSEENARVVCFLSGRITRESSERIVAENRSAALAARLLVSASALEKGEDLLRRGDFSAALAQFQVARDHLSAVMTVSGSPEIAALAARIEPARQVAARLAAGQWRIRIEFDAGTPDAIRTVAIAELQGTLGSQFVISTAETANSFPGGEYKSFAGGPAARLGERIYGVTWNTSPSLPLQSHDDIVLRLDRPTSEGLALTLAGDEFIGEGELRSDVAFSEAPGSDRFRGRAKKGETVRIFRRAGGYFLARAVAGTGWVYGRELKSEKIPIITVARAVPLYDASGRWIAVLEPGRYVVATETAHGTIVALEDGATGEIRKTGR